MTVEGNEKRYPCPRTFILRLAEPRLHKVTSWAHAAGKRFELTLVSEFSGKEVTSREFKILEEWTTWIGPIARIASLMLAGLAVPLEGDIADQLGEGADAMDKLGSLPAEEGGAPALDDAGKSRGRHTRRIATDAEMHQLQLLLQHIGLDPRTNGMAPAETRDGRWLWMTEEEAASHSRPEARFS